MLYRAPVDTSPVTEGLTLFKHQLCSIIIRFDIAYIFLNPLRREKGRFLPLVFIG